MISIVDLASVFNEVVADRIEACLFRTPNPVDLAWPQDAAIQEKIFNYINEDDNCMKRWHPVAAIARLESGDIYKLVEHMDLNFYGIDIFSFTAVLHFLPFVAPLIEQLEAYENVKEVMKLLGNDSYEFLRITFIDGCNEDFSDNDTISDMNMAIAEILKSIQDNISKH